MTSLHRHKYTQTRRESFSPLSPHSLSVHVCMCAWKETGVLASGIRRKTRSVEPVRRTTIIDERFTPMERHLQVDCLTADGKNIDPASCTTLDIDNGDQDST